MKAITSIYTAMLSLYPRGFREEYADEMLDVFRMRLEGVGGVLEMIRIVFGEIIALPSSILTVGPKEWRKTMKAQLKKYFDPAEGSLHEILLASLPIIFMFLVPGFITAIPGLEDAIPQPVGMTLIILMGGTLVVLGVFGLFAGLPRWSLFYAGILLNGLIFFMLAGISFSFLREGSKNTLLFLIIFFGSYIVLTAGIGFCGLWLSARSKEFRWFYDKVKNDWPLLSLVCYGGSFLIILLQYEDLAGYSWQMIVTGLLLFVGLVQFFRSQKAGNRLLGLILWQIGAVIITGIATQDFVTKVIPNLNNEVGVLGYSIIYLAASMIVVLLPVIFSKINNSRLFPESIGDTIAQD